MSEWRPDNWEKIKQDIIERYHQTNDLGNENKVLEAGASAMLKALREHGSYAYHSAEWVGTRKLGWMVFIPDDNKE